MAQQQKHLHELLKEDQEPFQLKHYIADRRLQLKKLDNKFPSKYSLQPLKKQKPNNNNTTSLCKHACFFSFQDSPSPARKAFLPSPSPGLAAASKSPARRVFRAGPLLLEAAMRIQKNPKKTQTGFGLFGSILKKIKSSNSGKKSEIIKNEVFVGRREEVCDEQHLRSGSCTSCNNSRLSSAGWSESNEEEKSMDFETSSSCLSDDNEEIEELVNGDYDKYCSSPLSPFRFSLQKCPSLTGCQTPDFSSPVASPVHHKEDKEKNYEGLANVEQEEDEKEQCSPVSVLDPPFDDDGQEGEYEYEDEDEKDDDCGSECNYALVQRAQQQLLYKLRRFEKLAELDPIELEKLMLEEEEEEEGDDDLEDDDNSVLSYRDRDYDTFASEVTIPFDMKRLVSDLISEVKSETNSLNNREEEVVFGRVCKRLDSWQHVRSDTIDMMVESDLKTELDDWKKFQAQREETAMEVEVSIFRLLVEELAEEMVHFAGHHGNFNKVFA